jgi:DNA-binding PadR family transcriptional regulator
MSRASYDLTRLRRNGLITRIQGRNRYRLTDDGLAFAIFYTKVHNRVLRPLMATDRPQAPPPVRAALRTIDAHIVSLRRKIESDPARPARIETVYGIGYRLRGDRHAP